ncbi:MAG: tetratricopeptide repeat protein [Planctomycetaceae bacterium]|nr:tetratricopeptide repeat protein [Planctomycetaceae bacterium]
MSEAANDTIELLKSAQIFFRQGDYQESIDQFQKVLAQDPNHLKALRGLAAAYAQANQVDEAIEVYTKLTTTDLTNGIAWLNLGALYNSQGRFKEATKAIRSGLIKEKKSALGYLYLGEAHIGLNQSSMAMTAFKEALKIDPELLDAQLGIGKLYLEMNSHAQAIRHFEQALKSHPDSKRAQAALRDAREGKEETRDSVNPFGRLVDMDNMGLKSNVVMNRELSKDEQLHDRQMVRSLSRDLMNETEHCLEKVRGEVEPALLSISRTLAEGGISPGNVLNSIEKLQSAIIALNEQRKKMRNKVVLIRAHEEIVNTPEFQGQIGTDTSSELSSTNDSDDDQSDTDD